MSEERIRFYEQVLELEPGSKLFFILARLYYDHRQLEKAAEVLKSGLHKHPEHMQARLLLAAIMEEHEDTESARGIYREVFELLFDHPGFWPALAEHMQSRNQKDPAMACAFLSAWLKDPGLTWTAVLQSGLENFFSAAIASPKSKEVLETSAQEPNLSSSEELETTPDEESFADNPAALSPEDDPHEPSAEKNSSSGSEQAYEDLPHESATADGSDISDQDSDHEETSEIDYQDAGTESMAGLLVAQGEYRKALDIYLDLWSKSLPGSERREIEESIRLLETKMASERAEKNQSSQKGDVEAEKDPDMTDFLSRLAERLEQRN